MNISDEFGYAVFDTLVSTGNFVYVHNKGNDLIFVYKGASIPMPPEIFERMTAVDPSAPSWWMHTKIIEAIDFSPNYGILTESVN